MSRPIRQLQKRFVVFCEGDTEYNYIDKMRKQQGVQISLKPINMHGGGYTNFLRKIKTESQTNCLAKFVENIYTVKKKNFEIAISQTDVAWDFLGRKSSNIEEFFDVIDW